MIISEEEYKRLKRIELHTWRLLDDSSEENGVLTIDMELSKVDLYELDIDLPEEEPPYVQP